MCLQQRPVLLRQSGVDFRQRNDAVRIPDRRRAKAERAAADRDFFIDDLATRAGYGNFVAPETDLAHFDAHGFAAVQHARFHHAALSLDGELFVFDQLPVPEITREDAQPIAALFRLAAVRIENAQRKPRLIRRQRPQQNPVRSDAKVPMTNHFDLRRCWRRRAIFGINHQVIVPQRVILEKLHGPLPLGCCP